MEDKMNQPQNNEIEIDLQQLLRALVSKAWLIGLAAVLCAVLTFFATLFFVTPLYQSSSMFYVNNNSLNVGEMALSSITSADITASKNLVNSYIVILKTRESINDVIDYAGVDRTYSEVNSMISAASVSSTEIFRVTVTSPDPEEAEKIADAIAYILPKRIANIIEGTSAKVVDSAVLPSRPSSPNYTRNTLLGFLAGLFGCAAVVVLLELLDITIRNEEDINRSCVHPVLAAVPDMNIQSKNGYYYGYGKQRKKNRGKTAAKDAKKSELVGGSISFSAAEAYKLLRTKLQFSFADEKDCRIIGVSSALAGEGKSLTAVNLAYTTAQLGKRVLLIDCDLRRPSLTDKLPLKKHNGLSDFLAGQTGAEDLIQLCGIKDDERAFHAIAPGRIPPNPMELLSSARMEKMLEQLRGSYDYIIMDLPPVGEVSDALAVARFTDGILMVVRQDYCDRIALNTAVRQFEFVDARILGVVFNCTREEHLGYTQRYFGGYYRRKYYKQYYQGYRGYGYRRSGR